MRWQPGQGELGTSRYIRRAAGSVALSTETIVDDTVDAGWQLADPAVINYAISPHPQETRDADDNRMTWFSGVVWLPRLSLAIPIPLSRRRSIILPIQFAGPSYSMQTYAPDATKHPVRSDFHTVVTEAGISVTFKPTNSVYSFCRLADANDIGRLGSISFAGVVHAEHNTNEDYSPDEVQGLAQRIASEFVGSVWFEERSPFAGIRSRPTNDITRPVSFANVPRRIASEVAATLRLIRNRDRAD